MTEEVPEAHTVRVRLPATAIVETEGSDAAPSDDDIRPDSSSRDSTIAALRRMEDLLASVRYWLVGIFAVTSVSLLLSIFVIAWAWAIRR